MRTAAKIIVAGVSTVALAGGIGAGLAYADPASPTPTPTTSPTASPPSEKQATPRDKARKRHGLLATALHGEVTLAGKEHRVVLFQRGPATKVSTTELSVRAVASFQMCW